MYCMSVYYICIHIIIDTFIDCVIHSKIVAVRIMKGPVYNRTKHSFYNFINNTNLFNLSFC